MPALLPALLWAALVGLFAGQFVVAGAMEWDEALNRAAAFWWPWLPLLPLTFGFSRWLLKRQVHPAASVLLHLFACAGVVALCQFSTPDRPLRGAAPPPGESQLRTPGRNDGEFLPPGEPGGPPWARGPRQVPRRQGPPEQLPPPRQDRHPAAGRPRGMLGPLGFRSVIDTVVYGGIVSLTHAIAFLRRSQQRERRTLELEASLTRARLDALRLQINPHFLFNTLNAIASLIHTQPGVADEMTVSLSELLRASLHGSGSHEVPLSGELNLLRLFTDIEQTRFGERLRFVNDIAPEALPGMVPSLILQPLVENAIRHGLEPRTGQGTVTIQARKEGPLLILSITDNGTGFSSAPSGRPSGGIGLTNTRDRLRALYGDRQSLTITPAEDGSGTTAVITIPFHASPA